jgi:mannan endo-1,4-beta-mannosidase
MYWQYGDQISSGPTADDKNTVFRGTKNWQCMVEAHGQDVSSTSLQAQLRPKIRFL